MFKDRLQRAGPRHRGSMKIYFSLFVCANLILLPGCDKAGDAGGSAATLLADAHKVFDAGDFRAARIKVEAALKADPKVSDAHFLAGQIAERSGDQQAAVNEYVTADATGRGVSKGRYAAAELMIRVKAYQLAEQWIAKCLADRPADPGMRAYRALLAERLGDTRKARAEAERILAEDKGNVVANAVLAEEALRRDDPAYALTIIAAGLSTDASDKALLQLKAQALLLQNSPDKAVEIYRALIAADPSAPDYRWALAELQAQTQGVARGEQTLREGVAASPASIDMHMRLVAFLGRHRDSKALEGELSTAIAAAPDTTAYDVALADVYDRSNRADAAIKVLNDAIARTHDDVARSAAQLALARMEIAHDDTAGARIALEAMLKASPADDNVLAVRGQLMLKDRKPAAAVQDFLSVATRQPANAAVFAALADAYLQNNQHAEAIAALKRVLSLSPSDAGVALRLVSIQSSFGELAEANRTVEDFLARNPASVEARVMQAALAIQRKDWTAADVALAALYHNEAPDADRKAVGLDAEVREARGQPSEAADLYRRLMLWKEGEPFSVAAARGFARTSIAAGRSAQAVDFLTGFATKVAPANLASYDLMMATLYNNLGQAATSQSLVEAAIQKAPADPAAYLQQARALAAKKDIAKSLAMLDRGIAAGAPKEPLMLARAEIQNAAGQGDAGLATYRELLRSNPNSIVGANELANRLADQKPLDKDALRQARDLLQKNANLRNQVVLDTLAWSNYRLGEVEDAKKLLSLANAGQSPISQLRFHYGAVLIASGDRAKGQDIIRTTLNDNYPGRDEAEEMLKINPVKAP
jgi:predicted Zn-dependent protease